MKTKELYDELNRLSLDELRTLTDLMDIGINFNEDEEKIKDIKGEIAHVLSLEPENKIREGLARLKNEN